MPNPLFETFNEVVGERLIEETIRFEEAGMVVAQNGVQIQLGVVGLETAARLALRWQLIHAVKAKQPLKICYKNHKGEVAIRHVMPTKFWHGTTNYHTKPGWFLKGLDLDKKSVERDFFVNDMKGVWIEVLVDTSKVTSFPELVNAIPDPLAPAPVNLALVPDLT